jgi:hypothetical protein
MDFNERVIIINREKMKIEEYIKSCCEMYKNNIKVIAVNYENHQTFLTFATRMNVCEIYKWEKLKMEYNSLKQKINMEKKLNKMVYKMYSSISSYYSEEEIHKYNNINREMNDTHILMLINFSSLQQFHFNTMLQFKKMLASDNVIKIYEYNEMLHPLFIRLNENYMNHILLDKKYYMIRKNKAKIISEINIASK